MTIPSPATERSALGRLGGTLRVAAGLPGALAFARLSRESIAAAQRRRVRATIEHAFRTVPFYAETMRALRLRPEDFREPADLARLPIVERSDIQRDPDRFLSRSEAKSAYLALRTGGSSGAPCVVYHDARSVLENVAHGERHRVFLRALSGRWRPRVLAIASPRGSEEELRAFVRRHAFVPGRVAIASRTMLTVADAPEEVVRRLAALRPDVVFGYGSYLERLGQVLEEGGERGLLPRVFAYGGDAMSPAARARIASGLGIRVWSTYQAVEALKIGFECWRERGLHVHADLCAVRIVDRAGRTVADGESGDVVVSNLVNRATVLLNYRLGDVSALERGGCPCGSALPLIAFPTGRLEDWLETPSGERVYTQRLRAIFTDEAEVWQYQIEQQSPSSLRVAIVPADAADRTAIARRVAERLGAVVGAAVRLRIEFVDDVRRTPTGKVRVILRRASPDQGTAPRA